MLFAVVVVLCGLLSATTSASSVQLDRSHSSTARHDAELSNRLRHGNGQMWTDDDDDQPTKTGREGGDEWRFSALDADPKVSESRPIVVIDDVTGGDGDGEQLQRAPAQQPFDSQPSKRRHHIFVGKKSVGIPAHRYQPEVESLDSLGDDNEEPEKRGRMFVGKRWPISSFDAQSDDNVAAFEKLVLEPSTSGGRVTAFEKLVLEPSTSGGRLSPTSQKRVRMFVGKKKAPFFVGRR